MIVLGLNAFGHDAAVVLLVDGRVVFASSEERHDRVRHSAAFPRGALQAALASAGVSAGDVDVVAFPWARGMALGHKVLHVLSGLPGTLAFLRERPADDLPGRVGYLLSMGSLARCLAAEGVRAPLVRVPHHLAHAASARLALPGGRGAVLTADGMGEWTTAAAWDARAKGLRELARAVYPHSLGKAYSAVTQWLGFRPESDEGKTMGLSAYGAPESPSARFVRGLVAADPRRLFRVDLEAFGYPRGHAALYGEPFLGALGPPRPPGAEPRPLDADVARGIQDGVEEAVLAAARRLLQRTAAADLALAGGLFLNCALNGRLLRSLGVPVHPFPVAGDAGAAWGAAAWVWERRAGRPAEPLRTLFLGHDLTPAEAEAALQGGGARPADLPAAVADRVAAGMLVGVARGRAEFGPRALGARSILASPRSEAIRDRVNARKGREAWRPLAPVVLEEDRALFRDLVPSPWMILTFEATGEARRRIPGAVHADGSARVQTVGRSDDPLLAAVIRALAARGEPPAVLNTSFNRRGEPIVDTAAEALTSARAMGLDAVVLGDRLLDLGPPPAAP